VVEAQEVHNYNAYNMAIAEERVHKLFDKTIYLASEHHTGNYLGIVVNLVGDMVSGGLHPELLKTDELEVIPSALKAIDWIVTGLTMMKGRFGKVYVPTVCGNHGQHRKARVQALRQEKFRLPHFVRRRKAESYCDFCMLPDDAEGPVVFFGSKEYVPLFAALTRSVKGEKRVFYNSSQRPVAPGCVLERFETRKRTNWQYECAAAFLKR
jgi:hypothetical protein